ncbi:fyve, partial [Tropilaelaps mercedesae]
MAASFTVAGDSVSLAGSPLSRKGRRSSSYHATTVSSVRNSRSSSSRSTASFGSEAPGFGVRCENPPSTKVSSTSTKSLSSHTTPRPLPRPRNAVAVRRTASRLCLRRHREGVELQQQLRQRLIDEGDTCSCGGPCASQLFVQGDQRRRTGVSFKFNGRSRSLQRGTVPSINDTGSLQLIGFRKVKTRSHSAEDTSPSRSESSTELEEALVSRRNSRLITAGEDPFEVEDEPYEEASPRTVSGAGRNTSRSSSYPTFEELAPDSSTWLEEVQFQRKIVDGDVPSVRVLLQNVRKPVETRPHLQREEAITRTARTSGASQKQSPAQAIKIGAPSTMERQESFKKLVKDTQEWLRSGGSLMGGDANPWSPSEQLEKFFEEAATKCSESSSEEFAEFLQRNRGSFNRLLETRYSGGKRLVDRDSGVFTEQEVQQHQSSISSSTGGSSSASMASSSATRSSSAVHSSGSSIATSASTPLADPQTSSPLASSGTPTASSPSASFQRQLRMVKSSSQDNHKHSVHKVSTVHRTESQIRTSGTHPEFKTIIELNGDNNVPADSLRHPDNMGLGLAASSEPQLRAAILKRPLSEFPRFPPLPSGSARLSCCQRMSTGFEANMSSSYHFSSASRSRFQYCGETNTFKFSTEHVSSSFSEQGYESVSESEDEESVDVDDADDSARRAAVDARAGAEGDGGKCNLVNVQGTLSASGTSDSLRAIDSSSTETTCSNNSQLSSGASTTNNASVAVRSESCATLNATELQQKTQNALREIAYELLTTERTYVTILTLLDQVFHFRVDQENRAAPMFSQEVITQMFSNLKSLYKLHNDFVLPKLEERLQNWEQKPGIGDLMRELAPFLKMYTEYVKNYDTAMHLIATWYQKQPRFAAIMDYVHSLPECGKLQVSHHMLTPVQRIPRYELLLKEYLKKLPEDSPDRDDTQ